MKNSFALAKKDFMSVLNSRIGVLIFSLFYLIAGIFFSLLITSYSKLSLEASGRAASAVEGLGLTRFVFSSLFLNLSIVLIFLVPLLSMRSFSEERKQETLELLFTYPFSDFEIVWGKFLGLVWFFELLTLPVFAYLGLVVAFGGSFDWGPVFCAYLGFWLLGNAYLSLGLFISSLTENQVASAMATFSLLIIFWVMEWVAGVSQGVWSDFFAALSPLHHYREFTLGILDLSHVAYFCFFHFYFLFLTLRSIETRNWKA
ncbi:MAG: ABC transporter permease subunit [Candidatus Omnitrophica bacterium]|nr:ABC transporter permease subunit [Candidatus Omnitrophota bacterium]